MKTQKSVDLENAVEFAAPAFITKAWVEKDEDGTQTRKIEMLASGIKIDAYHDRMSENAVKEMSIGMIGKDFLPDHHAEWHQVLGSVTDGRIDEHYQYWATVTLDPVGKGAEELADTLFRAVQAGKKIGVSIAGWIKRVMFEEDAESGREVRVIDSIGSDHIAATRTPAYADAHISGVKRSLVEKMFLPYLARSLDKAKIEKVEEHIDVIHIGKDVSPELWHFPIAQANAIKKAVSPKHYALADEDTPWSFDSDDGNKLIERGGWALFKASHAWYDDSEGDTPEVKFAYKLPHHKDVDGQVKTVWKGVAAAMSVLFGARGGADIPDVERKATYSHLAYHYKEFDKDVPVWNAIEPDLNRWLTYLADNPLSDDEIERNMDIMLSGDVPDCLKTEEIDDMDVKELAELLEQNNEKMAGQVAESIGQSIAPLNEAMTLMTQGMASIIKAQEKEDKVEKSEPEVEEKVDPVAAVAEELKALKARVAEYESEPQRKGEVMAETDKEASVEGEHYSMKIRKIFESDEFQRTIQEKPSVALRHYLSFYEDSAGHNHLLDEYREQGIVSSRKSAGWSSVA